MSLLRVSVLWTQGLYSSILPSPSGEGSGWRVSEHRVHQSVACGLGTRNAGADMQSKSPA